jgi:hypothetical protein
VPGTSSKIKTNKKKQIKTSKNLKDVKKENNAKRRGEIFTWENCGELS